MMTWPAYAIQKAVLLACLAGVTTAGAHPKPIPRKYSAVHRALILSNDSASKVPELFVTGRVVTVLRFEQPCDRERTKMLGWEGRFEPVECVGKKVLIEPLKDLKPEDRLLLVVTLADGSELPFTVTADEARRDMQVDVYPDPESPDAVRVALDRQRKENDRLQAIVRQQKDDIAWRGKVATSEDHALALLFAKGKASLMGFKELDKTLVRDEGAEILISTLVATEKSTNRKAVVVFEVTNTDPERPWVPGAAAIYTVKTGEQVPFVFWGWPASIAPGQTGRVALVTDLSSFDLANNGDEIAFEIYRDGGRAQGYIVWNAKHLLP